MAQIVKNTCDAADSGSISGSGRPPGEGDGNPLQYPFLGNPIDRGAWWATVHGITKSWIQLSESPSVMSDSFRTLWTVAHQAALSMGFSRQEYWSGLSFPSPGGLPDPEIERLSPELQADSLSLSHQGSLSFHKDC